MQQTVSEQQKNLITKIKRILFKTDKLASQLLAGEYKSAFKGTGINFDNIREYQPGDDIRNLDWKVTARMQSPYLRQYREERQLTVMLMIDLSASNNFGTQDQSKKEVIIEIASLLAFLASKNNDRVGIMLITDRVELFIKPKQDKSHIFRIIRDLLLYEPESDKTNFKKAFSEASKLMTKHSIVFVISDFLEDLPAGKTSLSYYDDLKIMRKIQDLTAISIRDPKEFELPDIGFVTICDPESGEQRLLNLNRKSTRDLYHEKQCEQHVTVRNAFTHLNIDFVDIYLDKPYIPELIKLFLKREKRIA
jgi:uncharacterized protein (DUF58 family)